MTGKSASRSRFRPPNNFSTDVDENHLHMQDCFFMFAPE